MCSFFIVVILEIYTLVEVIRVVRGSGRRVGFFRGVEEELF